MRLRRTFGCASRPPTSGSGRHRGGGPQQQAGRAGPPPRWLKPPRGVRLLQFVRHQPRGGLPGLHVGGGPTSVVPGCVTVAARRAVPASPARRMRARRPPARLRYGPPRLRRPPATVAARRACVAAAGGRAALRSGVRGRLPPPPAAPALASLAPHSRWRRAFLSGPLSQVCGCFARTSGGRRSSAGSTVAVLSASLVRRGSHRPPLGPCLHFVRTSSPPRAHRIHCLRPCGVKGPRAGRYTPCGIARGPGVVPGLPTPAASPTVRSKSRERNQSTPAASHGCDRHNRRRTDAGR